RVGGEHGPDLQPRQPAANVFCRVPLRLQALEGPARRRGLRGGGGVAIRAPAAQTVHLLGRVHQKEQNRERSRDRGRQREGQRVHLLQNSPELGAVRSRAAPVSAADPQPLDGLETILALQAADHLSEAACKPADVFVKRAVDFVDIAHVTCHATDETRTLGSIAGWAGALSKNVGAAALPGTCKTPQWSRARSARATQKFAASGAFGEGASVGTRIADVVG